MPYTQDTENCFAAAIGQTGLAADAFADLLGPCEAAMGRLRAGHEDGSLALLRLPERRNDLEAMEEVAERYRADFADVVVLGTGGASLGGRTLARLRLDGAGWEAGGMPDNPALHFMDNVDPHSFETLFRRLDPSRTGFLVISKSGGTAETLAQFLHCFDVFCNVLGEATRAEQFTVITQPSPSPLRQMAEAQGLPILDHDPDIEGRFSALTPAGLLPAMIAGADGEALRGGAGAVLETLLSDAGPEDFAPALGAAINVGLARVNGVNATVLMPYVDRLADFAGWFRQLWAESLGKDGKGTTPIAALGTVDQHSQLQLYLDGPRDKMFTLIHSAARGTGGVPADALTNAPGLGFLAGHAMGDLLDAEQRATAETLAEAGCPTRVLRLGEVDERAMGALMMHFMLETLIAAQLWGVDPFGQPAVEAGKALAKRYLKEMTTP